MDSCHEKGRNNRISVMNKQLVSFFREESGINPCNTCCLLKIPWANEGKVIPFPNKPFIRSLKEELS